MNVCQACGGALKTCTCEHVLEAVPVDQILELMRKATDPGIKEWSKITEMEARVAALEPVYEQCPDCKALLERVAGLERLCELRGHRMAALEANLEHFAAVVDARLDGPEPYPQGPPGPSKSFCLECGGSHPHKEPCPKEDE